MKLVILALLCVSFAGVSYADDQGSIVFSEDLEFLSIDSMPQANTANTYSCRSGTGASEAVYQNAYDWCNSLAGCGAICYGAGYRNGAHVNGTLYTNGNYTITCTCQ